MTQGSPAGPGYPAGKASGLDNPFDLSAVLVAYERQLNERFVCFCLFLWFVLCQGAADFISDSLYQFPWISVQFESFVNPRYMSLVVASSSDASRAVLRSSLRTSLSGDVLTLQGQVCRGVHQTR